MLKAKSTTQRQDQCFASERGRPTFRRYVTGHTIQQPGGVNAACDGRVLRVDVGMSAGCGDSPPEVLEILRDGAGGISRLRLDERTGAVLREPVAGAQPAAPITAAVKNLKGAAAGAGDSYYYGLFGGGRSN